MIPVRLKLQGFLSYLQPQEVDFTGFDMACISGHNGAGKSSLLDAITWALFGKARTSERDAVINDQSERAEVTLDFLYEGHLYRVIRSRMRGKTSLLEFFVSQDGHTWRPLTESKMSETQARIEHLLRMDYETFINASFFLQGKADQFTIKNPGERKQILMNILGLEIWERYKESAAARRRQTEQELAALEGQLQEIERELAEEPQRHAELRALEAELKQAEEQRRSRESVLENARRLEASLAERRHLVQALHNQWQTAREGLERQQRTLEERQALWLEAQTLLQQAEAIEAAYAAWQEARRDLERWEDLASQFRDLEAQRKDQENIIALERARLETELKRLQAEATRMANEAASLAAMEAQVMEDRRQMQAIEERLAERPHLQRQKEELGQRYAQLRVENDTLYSQMQELKEHIAQLEAIEGATCPICGKPLTEEERQDLIQQLTQEGKQKAERYRENKEALKDLETQNKRLDEALRDLELLERQAKTLAGRLAQEEERLQSIQQRLQTWEEGEARRLREVESLLREERFAPEARQALQALDEQCRALGYDPQAHQAARQREQEGRASEEALRRLERARAEVGVLEREIASLQEELARRRAEVAALEAEYQQAEARLQQEAADLPDLLALEREVRDLKERENQLRSRVGGARQKVEVLGTLRRRREEVNLRRGELQVEITRLKRLEEAFSKNGVPALLIEQALPEIQAQANDLLDRLSNGTMSVAFETQREFKSKEGKGETLDILIRDGSGIRPYEMFSGGEAFRINFAIRLALARVLAQRAGARLQTLVIDEGFGSQDLEGRQRLIEALSLVRQDFAKILVITHLEELKDAFPARIEVEKTPQGSRVRVWTV